MNGRGKASPRYGTGRTTHMDGYMRLWLPGHPMANADGYALEHRVVLHEAGVDVPRELQVHHKNGDKADNRLENLELLDAAEHTRQHLRAVGYVTNQYGTWPLMTPEEKREKNRQRCAAYDAKRRAAKREAS